MTPPTILSRTASDEHRDDDRNAAESERPQRRDLARAAGDGGVHRVDRAEDRADPHQTGDDAANRPDDPSAATRSGCRSSPARASP